MAVLFNFRSEAAMKSAKKVSDHHKGWTLCRIARMAITKELIVPFVRAEMVKPNPSLQVASFLKFTMDAVNPNYTFMCDMVLELLDAVFMYRVGNRCANTKFMEAGRAKFAKVWTGRFHPLYRELEMGDTIALSRMPPAVRKLYEQSWSLNTSSRPYTGEGGDFRLEEVNRVIQQWLPKVPSGKDWQKVCANHDDLVRLREVVNRDMGVPDPADGKGSVQDISEEIKAFRTLLRSSEYLMHPKRNDNHKSIDCLELHPDPEKVRYKVIGVEMKGMESSMKLVALGAIQRRG